MKHILYLMHIPWGWIKQRQISCNIQNDNKTCVNANIYSI